MEYLNIARRKSYFHQTIKGWSRARNSQVLIFQCWNEAKNIHRIHSDMINNTPNIDPNINIHNKNIYFIHAIVVIMMSKGVIPPNITCYPYLFAFLRKLFDRDATELDCRYDAFAACFTMAEDNALLVETQFSTCGICLEDDIKTKNLKCCRQEICQSCFFMVGDDMDGFKCPFCRNEFNDTFSILRYCLTMNLPRCIFKPTEFEKLAFS